MIVRKLFFSENNGNCLLILMKKERENRKQLLRFVRIGFIMIKTGVVSRRKERTCLSEIIAVVSGKGGTGKTTVTAGLAEALAQSGSRVLCIDCDVGLRNLDISLAMTESGSLSFRDVSEFGYSLENAPHHSAYPSLAFLTAPMNCRPEEVNRESFCDLLRQARAQYDFIFLDAPAGVDAGFRMVTEPADRVFVVTGAAPAAVRDAGRVGDLLEVADKHNVRIIVNRLDKGMLSSVRMTVDDIMDTAGLPLMGILPEDSNVTLAAAFGVPLLKYSPRGGAARALRRIARRMQGLYSPIPMR